MTTMGGYAANCFATPVLRPATLRAVDNSPDHRRDEPAALDSRPAVGTRVDHSSGRRRTVDNRESLSLLDVTHRAPSLLIM
jgi:hypothetical protein